MARRVLAVLILLLVVSFGMRCGSSTTTPSTSVGSVYTFIGDTPICDVLALRFNITQLILYITGSSFGETLLSSLNSLIPIDLAEFRGSSTILNFTTTTAQGYNRLGLGLAVGSMYIYDPSANPPFTTVTENLTTGTTPPIYNINPPLTIPASGVSVIFLDFDFEHSIQIDSQGQITGAINPMVTVTAPTASPSTGFGEVDGIKGFITSVTTAPFTSGSTMYTGGAMVQTLASVVSGAGSAALTVDFTNNSIICGPTTFSNQACCQSGVTAGMNPACSVGQAPLGTILTDSYAAADGFVDRNGEFEANTLTLGPQENPFNQQAAFIGPVLSLTRDAAGVVTAFTMFLRDLQPPIAGISLDAPVTVNLFSNTLYQTFPPPIYTTASPTTATGPNFAALPYGPSAISIGQDVVANGVYTLPPSTTPPTPVSVAASELDLDLQTHEGNFVSLLGAQSDDRTGGFLLAPCATLLQQDAAALPIYVFTSAQTVFANTVGLSALQPQTSLLVKGLLFYEPQSVTVNGISVPPGKLVMLAKQIVQGQ